MSNRRALIEGIKASPPPVDTDRERDFVYGQKQTAAEAPEPRSIPGNVGRTPLSTRIRPDFFAALKRASLERQLKGQGTSTLIEILEEAIEPWLKTNGYLE